MYVTKIENIYKVFKGTIPFFENEKEEYKELLEGYINDCNMHLFIDDKIDRSCMLLNEEQMLEKYKSKEHLESGMLNFFDRPEDISYETFCVYIEIKALYYFGKDLKEIKKIINERY